VILLAFTAHHSHSFLVQLNGVSVSQWPVVWVYVG